MNILLIQRKQEFAKELKIAWKEQGNIVDIAGNYESALQFFYAGNYDIVLLHSRGNWNESEPWTRVA